jgi:hypothetical protein
MRKIVMRCICVIMGCIEIINKFPFPQAEQGETHPVWVNAVVRLYGPGQGIIF